MNQRLLVVRGDLNSSSGYAQAIELYTLELAQHFDLVVGVDLHPNPVRRLERWPYPVVADAEAVAALREADGDHLVLTVSTPNMFRRFPGARNVGLFFWETSAAHQPVWQESIAAMDELWLPSRFMIDLLTAEGTTIPMRHVPCPIRYLRDQPAPDPATRSDVLLHEVSDPREPRPLSSLLQVRAQYRHVALCTNTLLARKGFPVLASEWLRFVDGRDDAALVIKVSSIDVTESSTALLARTGRLFTRVGDPEPGPRPHVFVTTANLPSDAMRALLGSVDLFVTPSFGEGLGLGVFEALFAGRPAVCALHTSFAELLPDDYRYAVDCDVANVGLYDPVGLIPPSARWGVPREGAIDRALRRCVDDLASGAATAHVDGAVACCIARSTIDFAALVAPRERTGVSWFAS